MQNNINPRHSRSNNNRVMVGLIIILVGFLAFIKSFNFFFFPEWIFSWPMILIVIGLITGSKSNFQKPMSYILIFLGLFFLIQRGFDLEIGSFFWPIVIIGVGFYLILGNRHKKRGPYNRNHNSAFEPGDDDKAPYQQKEHYAENDLDWDRRVADEAAENGENEKSDFINGTGAEPEQKTAGQANEYQSTGAFSQFDQEDFIDSVSVFGAVKKVIFSKNFKGGDIVNIMGGTDINLMNANIQGPVVLDIVQLFGGCTIIVPSHWKVYSDMSAIFGGVDDKRMINPSNVDNSKTLYIKGVTLFGGVTIKGF